MKYIIFFIAILSGFSFTGNYTQPKQTTFENKIDKQLDFRRTRALQDNTTLHQKLNELVNNL